ncbi:hypothetical protein C10C_0046 [Chlamydia serpentis]|uniref:Uncharacterized protein n=1 Tax=Chlamydia serpentis TaxID=1967782 RepID=A0A2R8FAE9_9CHLA|nr:hypothetical protein [Chlamydia serpentis]SPN73237.1 hypothetical protein C10C_0046 [Chlamydia serpentis]
MIKKIFIYSLFSFCSFSISIQGVCNETVCSPESNEQNSEHLIAELNGLLETLIEEGKEIRKELQTVCNQEENLNQVQEKDLIFDEGMASEDNPQEYVLNFLNTMLERLNDISKMSQSSQISQIIDCFNREFEIRNRELELKNRELELRDKDLEFKKSILSWEKEKASQERAFQREQDVKQTLMLLKK